MCPKEERWYTGQAEENRSGSGSGLGATAINYGYYRTQLVIEYAAVIVLVILVQIIQSIGTRTAVGSDRRITKKGRRKGLRDANRQVSRDKRVPPGAM